MDGMPLYNLSQVDAIRKAAQDAAQSRQQERETLDYAAWFLGDDRGHN